ncbi:helix-turn-helix domain-containing protein [Enterococcus sp. LJL90]
MKQEEKNWLSFFDVIIFSESLTNQVVGLLIERFSPKDLQLFRVEESSIDETKTCFQNSNSEITWLSPEISLAELREELAKSASRQEQTLPLLAPTFFYGKPEENETNRLQNFLSNLSKKERQTFVLLYRAKGQTIKRKDLASALWGGSVTQSNLAQLSQIISKLKMKLMKVTADEDSLTTSWRKGYALSKILCEKFAPFEEEQFIQNH